VPPGQNSSPSAPWTSGAPWQQRHTLVAVVGAPVCGSTLGVPTRSFRASLILVLVCRAESCGRQCSPIFVSKYKLVLEITPCLGKFNSPPTYRLRQVFLSLFKALLTVFKDDTRSGKALQRLGMWVRHKAYRVRKPRCSILFPPQPLLAPTCIV